MTRTFQRLEIRLRQVREGMFATARLFRGVFLLASALTVTTGLLVKRYAEFGDVLAKMSRRIGLSVEDLQGLSYAADSNNVQFTRVEKGLQRFGTELSRLSLRTSTYRTELEGLDPVLLRQLERAKSVQEGFDILVKTIRETEDGTKKLRLAQTAFGQGTGAKLLQVIGNTTGGFESFTEQLKEANALLTTQETVLFEKINQAYTDFSVQMRGRWANAVAYFGEEILDLLAGFTDLSNAIQRHAFPVLKELRVRFHELTDELAFFYGLIRTTNIWEVLGLSIRNSVLGFFNFDQEALEAEMEEAMDRFAKAVNRLDLALLEQHLARQKRYEEYRRADPFAVDLNEADENERENEKELLAMRLENRRLRAAMLEEIAKINEETAKRREEEAERLQNAYRFGTEFRASREARIYEELQKEAEETKKRFDAVGESIRTGLVDGFLQASNAADVFAGVLQQIQRQLLDMFVAGPIAEGLATILHAGFSRAFPSSGGPSPHTPRNPHVPYRAAGGPVDAGRLYRVNERLGSPEFFAPNTGGRVIPLGEMQGASGPSVVINIAGVEDEAAFQKVGGLVKREVLAVLPGHIGRLAHQPGGVGTQLRRI